MDRKKLPYSENSADYQAGLMAGAHRMADFLIRALEEKYPDNLDLYSFVEEKKWQAIEEQFDTEFDAMWKSF